MSNKVLPDFRSHLLSDRIRDDLEYRIRSSLFKPGERLAPEPELAARLGVSRNSLREAVKALQASGLLIKRRGIGTFVTRQRPLINLGIETLMGISQFIGAQGFRSLSRVNGFERGVRDGQAAEALGVAPDCPLVMLETTKFADRDPVAVCLDFVPEHLFDVPPRPEKLHDSIFDGLERHHGISIGFAECEILSVPADAVLAEKLDVADKTPLLLMKQVHYDELERKVLFSRSYFPSDKLAFRIIRRRLKTGYGKNRRRQ